MEVCQSRTELGWQKSAQRLARLQDPSLNQLCDLFHFPLLRKQLSIVYVKTVPLISAFNVCRQVEILTTTATIIITKKTAITNAVLVLNVEF